MWSCSRTSSARARDRRASVNARVEVSKFVETIDSRSDSWRVRQLEARRRLHHMHPSRMGRVHVARPSGRDNLSKCAPWTSALERHRKGLEAALGNSWGEDADRIRALHPRHVLFVCVANSARSQIAAAVARALAPPSVKISSAGTRPLPIHPLAVEALADLGFDVRGAPSRSVDEIPPDDVDVVITLCAEDVGATFRGNALRIHWPLPDPNEVTGSDEARLEAFRNLRDELVRRLALAFHGSHPLTGAG